MEKHLVMELKEAMESLKSLRGELLGLQEAFDELNADLIKKVADAKIRMIEAQNAIRSVALAEYKENKQKKLLGGIGIRETTKAVYSLEKAEAYAKEKDLFMKFDEKAFVKAAPSLNLSFFSTTKEPSVTFPKEVILDE